MDPSPTRPRPDAAAIWRVLLTSTASDPLPDLVNLFGPPSWHSWAACRGEETATFFPGKGKSATKARAICEVCPVRAECLAWALAQDDDLAGVWAGTTAAQRRNLHRTAAA